MTILDDLKQRCREWDAARPRSSQAEVGWSEVGGCRAYLGYRLAGEWPTNTPDGWGALRGTIIHLFMESLFDRDGELTEVTTTYRGIPGHADMIRTATGLWDIKTTKLVNLMAWQRSEAALLAKRIQSHGYAASEVDAGRLPADCTVGLIVIPADGTYDDWWLFEEPFNRELADAGADRLEYVKQQMAQGRRLPKDENYQWCERWCEFFSLCRGGDDPLADEKITNPELAALIDAYGTANAAKAAADKIVKKLAPEIRGLRGVTDAWRVSHSKPGEPKKVLDEDWVRLEYQLRGERVPEITVPGSEPKLYVRPVKKP
ncbi:MAG TPA: hypothetical protein VFQ44_02480 [Streptosporangiaceae bacterium]|nr:hypothetical protein [Streptosporangiaceae bacterium]